MKTTQKTFHVAMVLIVMAFFDGLTCPGATLYVWQISPNPAPPYATWATASRVIQEAVEAAAAGDAVLVTNGIYATGGQKVNAVTNRVAVEKAILVRSVNGPRVTVIEGAPSADSTFFGLGDAAVRCVYLGEGAQLSGFTLTNGHTRIGGFGGGARCHPSAVLTNCIVINNQSGDPENDSEGGGVYQGILHHCWLIGNISHGEGGGAASSTLFNCVVTGNVSGDGGGGVSGCTLYNCLLTGNRSSFLGGGSFWGTLNNCTLTGNSAAGEAGGAYYGTLKNCIVQHNTAVTGANYINEEPFGSLNFTSTFPLPTNGLGNITNEPAFVDAFAGDYRLRPGSPCIDAGTNLSSIIINDLDDNPRPLDGDGDGIAAFDMGAYEFGPLPRFSSVSRAAGFLTLSWSPPSGLILQRTATLTNITWTDVPTSNGQSRIEWPLSSGNEFFRLFWP